MDKIGNFSQYKISGYVLLFSVGEYEYAIDTYYVFNEMPDLVAIEKDIDKAWSEKKKMSHIVERIIKEHGGKEVPSVASIWANGLDGLDGDGVDLSDHVTGRSRVWGQ